MFVKGQSGNPSGRPRMPEGEREAWNALALKARAKLEGLIDSGECPPNVLAKIAELAADRSWGKPIQSIEAEIEDRRPILIDAAYGEKVETPGQATGANPTP